MEEQDAISYYRAIEQGTRVTNETRITHAAVVARKDTNEARLSSTLMGTALQSRAIRVTQPKSSIINPPDDLSILP